METQDLEILLQKEKLEASDKAHHRQVSVQLNLFHKFIELFLLDLQNMEDRYRAAAGDALRMRARRNMAGWIFVHLASCAQKPRSSIS
jgi:hypothetical protein